MFQNSIIVLSKFIEDIKLFIPSKNSEGFDIISDSFVKFWLVAWLIMFNIESNDIVLPLVNWTIFKIELICLSKLFCCSSLDNWPGLICLFKPSNMFAKNDSKKLPLVKFIASLKTPITTLIKVPIEIEAGGVNPWIKP